MEDIETQSRARKKELETFISADLGTNWNAIDRARERLDQIDAGYEAQRRIAMRKFIIGVIVLVIVISTLFYLLWGITWM